MLHYPIDIFDLSDIRALDPSYMAEFNSNTLNFDHGFLTHMKSVISYFAVTFRKQFVMKRYK